eukprot:2553728-Rhodomonas_salina.1
MSCRLSGQVERVGRVPLLVGFAISCCLNVSGVALSTTQVRARVSNAFSVRQREKAREAGVVEH